MDPERWQRVAHIYELTLEREQAERAAFLAAASADDAELRREVESLLASDSTPVLIDRPMLEVAAAVLVDDAELEPGTQLGPYRIDVLLGAGGMGQVYRAMDTRLNRTVAVKVLPKALATDSQFRARFDREAQAIAALTHPHICTLHDIGNQDGVDFLVMEYLEGETLAVRLEKGPLAVDQVLRYGIEISDALATAHHHGIIHRDLKPGNIILTRSGAQLLDFGLAKPIAPVLRAGGASSMPTTPAPVTAQGTILGTFQYMAPEQLEGKDADARTDIFAFGAVIYEMLTGKKAFEGNSQAGLIGAIMYAEPPAIATVRPLTPPTLDRIVKVCLAKDADERWQSARDLCRELQWIGHDPAASPVIRPRKRERFAWALAIVLAIGTVALAVRLLNTPSSNPQVARFAVAAPSRTSIPLSNHSPEISPDGTRLLFRVERGGESLLAIRSIDALDAQILAGTEGASFPFWSPDSRVIAFFADGRLKKMDVSGGPIQIVCEARSGLGGTWNRQDVIVFTDRDGLYRVPAAGGQPTALTASHDGGRFRYRPQFLPDGRRFLYFVQPDAVYLASLDGGEPRRIVTNTSSVALYVAPGYLLFRQGRTLVAQRFDSDLTNPLGDPVSIGEDIVPAAPLETAAAVGGAPFSVSENGVLAYAMSPETNVQLGWFDRAGRPLGTIGPFPFEAFSGVELSPDGTQIAMQSPPGPSPNAEIWLFDLVQGRPTQLTFSAGSDRRPIWSPNGRRLVFASLRQGAPGLYLKLAGGEQPEELLLRSQSAVWDEHWPADWSSNGILLESGLNRDSLDLWMLPLDGDRKPYPVVREPGLQTDSRLSRDGRWVAYTHMLNGTSRPDVYVRSLSTDAKWRISTAGGAHPRWRRDGKELFYLASDGKLMAVPIGADAGALRLGASQPLFQTGLSALRGGRGSFNVSADGQRFLMENADDQSPTSSIVVVSNWPAALKR